MDLNQFLDRQATVNYNCGDFVTEVWEYLTGDDISHLCRGFYAGILDGSRKRLTRLNQPHSPCLVMMKHEKYEPHVGVFYRGKVLHLDSGVGAKVETLESLRTVFKLSYYK